MTLDPSNRKISISLFILFSYLLYGIRNPSLNRLWKIVLLTLGISSSFSAFSQEALDPNTTLAYYLKIYDVNYRNNDFLTAYLRDFDAKYSSYRDNEFELKKQQTAASNSIQQSIAGLNDTAIYSCSMSSEFGDYNFETSEFAFAPFGASDRSYFSFPGNALFSSHYYYLNRYMEDNQGANIGQQILITNGSDFNGLPFNQEAADVFLKSRTTNNAFGGYVNRTVYLKLYYTILNEKCQRTEYNRIYNDLKCYVYKVEVWDDECMRDKKLAVLGSTSTPPSYLLPTKNSFDQEYSLGHVPFRPVLILESGWAPFLNGNFVSKYGCDNPYFLVHIRIQKSETMDVYEMTFKFLTNANACFSPGFIYTLFDKNNNAYPLAVSTVVNDGDINHYKLATLRISKKTMEVLRDVGLQKVRFQLNPSATNPGLPQYVAMRPRNGASIDNSEWIQWTVTETDAGNFKNVIRDALLGKSQNMTDPLDTKGDDNTPKIDSTSKRVTDLIWMDCNDSISRPSSQKTAITFTNSTQVELKLYWIDFMGQRRLYGTLGPGKSVIQPTYVGHVWLIANANDSCRCKYKATNQPNLVANIK